MFEVILFAVLVYLKYIIPILFVLLVIALLFNWKKLPNRKWIIKAILITVVAFCLSQTMWVVLYLGLFSPA